MPQKLNNRFNRHAWAGYIILGIAFMAMTPFHPALAHKPTTHPISSKTTTIPQKATPETSTGPVVTPSPIQPPGKLIAKDGDIAVNESIQFLRSKGHWLGLLPSTNGKNHFKPYSDHQALWVGNGPPEKGHGRWVEVIARNGSTYKPEVLRLYPNEPRNPNEPMVLPQLLEFREIPAQ